MDPIDAIDYSGKLAFDTACYAGWHCVSYLGIGMYLDERGDPDQSVNQWHNAVFHSQIAIAASALEGRNALLSTFVTWTNTLRCGLAWWNLAHQPELWIQ
jgi:hypothetical protein